MRSDGKELEALVSFIESQMLPTGFSVTNNTRLYGESGEQIAEFDIVVCGMLGTTKINWLLECRDRPGQGAAPGAWIEQLVGRRARFGFNKITAVSTTGFSPSAIDCAKREGIELREVKSLNVENFRSWLGIGGFTFIKNVFDLKHVRFTPPPDTATDDFQALALAISSANGLDSILKSIQTGKRVTPTQAFLAAASGVDAIKEGIGPGKPPKKVILRVRWPDDDFYVIETQRGEIRVFEAIFDGEVRVEIEERPIVSTKEYKNIDSDEPISQMVGFRIDLDTGPVDIEMHKLPEKGIYIIARPKNTDIA